MTFIYIYLFWVCYVASIRVYNLYTEGKLSTAQVVWASLLVGGFVLADIALNCILEVFDWTGPGLDKEQTLSKRFARWSKEDGWRAQFANWFGVMFLHVYDDGDHYN